MTGLARFMIRSSLVSFVCLLSAFAQQSNSTPSSQPETGFTLHTTSKLVIVDVVVTDEHQKPIHNLKAADFTLTENGSAQSIKSFEEHTAVDGSIRAESPPAGVFTNDVSVRGSGPVNVLLFDVLNTSASDQSYVRDQLKKYLASAKPGVPVAIFGLTSRLILLQALTDDPDLLKAALNVRGLRADPIANTSAKSGDMPKLSDSLQQALNNSPGHGAAMAQIVASLKQLEAQEGSDQLQTRAKYTLDAMNQLARYLAGIPGRKNLLWFSGSFPLNVLPDSNLRNPFAGVANFEQEFQETTNLLAESQVSVYPIAAAGIATSSLFGSSVEESNSASNPELKPKSASNPEEERQKSSQQTSDNQITMKAMAEQTGGRAFVSTNGLAEAVSKAMETGSNYYTLSYAPNDDNQNGKFRKIDLRVQQKGANLAYRRGYYGNAPGYSDLSGGSAAPVDAMSAAIMHGAILPTQIIFKSQVLPSQPASAPLEQALDTGTRAGPDPSRSRGPYRSYVIEITAPSDSLVMTATADGHYKAAVEYATIAYDSNGTVITSTGNRARLDIPSAAYAKFVREGLHLRQKISVPAEGLFYLRTAVHDTVSDRVGAIEFPLSAIANLPPKPDN